jgi:hypothetical protein
MYSAIQVNKIGMDMANKRVTLSVDANIYEEYKKYWKKKALSYLNSLIIYERRN